MPSGGVTEPNHMKRVALFVAVFVGFGTVVHAALPAALRAGAGASREIVSAYAAVFDRPPEMVPSFRSVDGPLAGNGDIGLTLSGPPEAQRYWISKNDFWKSGPDFKQCGPSLIGGLDLRIDGLQGASYHVEQQLYESVIASKFVRGEACVEIDARVMATANVIVWTLRAGGQPARVSLNLWAKEGYGAKTGSGRDGAVCWVSRQFDAPDLLYPTAATIALRCLASEGPSFLLEPGKPVTIVACVMTNHESDQHETGAKGKVAGIGGEEAGRLLAAHQQWWRDFWAQSWVRIEDKLLEKFYYGSLYIMACCSRNPNFPPGLYGNWITKDRTAWAGDIHLNYNHQAAFWALYSSNRVAQTEPYDAPLLEHMPVFRADAAKYLKTKGFYAGVGIGPKGLNSRFFDDKGMVAEYAKQGGGDNYDDVVGQPMFLGQKSNALFGAMNMLLRYDYTRDEAYLRKVYPYLSGVAEFWENDLKLENGRYVVHDDNFEEVGPWQGAGWRKGYGDTNPITTLGFLRVFLPAMIGFSETLDKDRERRQIWRDIVARLSDLPVCEDKGRRRFRACEGGGSGKDIVGLRWLMLHALVYPATNIGLGSDPSLLKMIRDDMAEWDDAIWIDHGNAFQTVFIGAARVGCDPDFLLAKARLKIAKCANPNLWIPADGGIETCSGIPGMLNEMMLQSHNGVVRVFPVFPATQQATFYRLRTFGALLVSGAIDHGRVRYVVVESEKGGECRLRNPWPGKPVMVRRGEGKAERVVGEELVLKSEPGDCWSLVAEGAEPAEREMVE